MCIRDRPPDRRNRLGFFFAETMTTGRRGEAVRRAPRTERRGEVYRRTARALIFRLFFRAPRQFFPAGRQSARPALRATCQGDAPRRGSPAIRGGAVVPAEETARMSCAVRAPTLSPRRLPRAPVLRRRRRVAVPPRAASSDTKDNNSQSSNDKKPPTVCLLYTSPSPRDQRGSRMPSSA